VLTRLNVTQLPQLLADATHATTETAQRLSGLQRAIIERLGSLDRGVRDVLALLPAVAADLERVRATVEPQHERVAAIERGLAILPAVAADLKSMRATVEPQHERVAAIEQTVSRLEARLVDLQATLALLKTDVEEATEHLPPPNAPGPLARARDTLGTLPGGTRAFLGAMTEPHQRSKGVQRRSHTP
jgi:chromosome segregation ATPase